MKKNLILSALLAFGVVVGLCAVDSTWDGHTDGNWSTTNWSAGAAHAGGSATDNLTFGNATVYSATNDFAGTYTNMTISQTGAGSP